MLGLTSILAGLGGGRSSESDPLPVSLPILHSELISPACLAKQQVRGAENGCLWNWRDGWKGCSGDEGHDEMW